MLLNIGTNDTLRDRVEHIKRTYSELWEKKWDAMTKLISSLILQVEEKGSLGVDVPCKLTAGSIVSVSDTFSVFAFMTMVFYSEKSLQTSC